MAKMTDPAVPVLEMTDTTSFELSGEIAAPVSTCCLELATEKRSHAPPPSCPQNLLTSPSWQYCCKRGKIANPPDNWTRPFVSTAALSTVVPLAR